MASSDGLTPHAARNREFWDRQSDTYQARNFGFIERGHAWGLWQLPESELRLLGSVAGKDVLEFGCGAAEWSRALLAEGARPVGIDNSEQRLGWARKANAEAGVDFPLVHGSAESTPFEDASFDVVMCDWGAMTFADPFLTVPEAARVLRPGGLLVWSGGTPWSWAAYDAPSDEETDRLQADYFGMHRWDDPEGAVEFMLPYGEWIRLFRANGLLVEDLIEVQAARGRALHLPLGGADRLGAPLADGADLEGAQGVSMSPAPPLLLASTSPQRRAILEQLGIPFDVVAPDYEEHDPPEADAVELVREHARGKARSVAAQAGDRPVLAVDTAVSLGGRIYGKPANATEAESMLEQLEGETHVVVSGLCLLTAPSSGGGWEVVEHSETRVRFRALAPRDLAAYVGDGEWEGRAGAYAIQGRGAALVEHIEGDYLNVVGLPAALLVRLLAERFSGLYGFG